MCVDPELTARDSFSNKKIESIFHEYPRIVIHHTGNKRRQKRKRLEALPEYFQLPCTQIYVCAHGEPIEDVPSELDKVTEHAQSGEDQG